MAIIPRECESCGKTYRGELQEHCPLCGARDPLFEARWNTRADAQHKVKMVVVLWFVLFVVSLVLWYVSEKQGWFN